MNEDDIKQVNPKMLNGAADRMYDGLYLQFLSQIKLTNTPR